jgi:hypothetical protein
MALETATMACSWPMTRCGARPPCAAGGRSRLGQLEDRDAGPDREDLGDLLVVDLGDDVHVAGLPLLLALRLLAEQRLLLVAQRRGLLEVLRVDRDSLSRRTPAMRSSNSRRSGGAVIRRMRMREPASSMRSIALSGRKRSEM